MRISNKYTENWKGKTINPHSCECDGTIEMYHEFVIEIAIYLYFNSKKDGTAFLNLVLSKVHFDLYRVRYNEVQGPNNRCMPLGVNVADWKTHSLFMTKIGFTWFEEKFPPHHAHSGRWVSCLLHRTWSGQAANSLSVWWWISTFWFDSFMHRPLVSPLVYHARNNILLM